MYFNFVLSVLKVFVVDDEKLIHLKTLMEKRTVIFITVDEQIM